MERRFIAIMQRYRELGCPFLDIHRLESCDIRNLGTTTQITKTAIIVEIANAARTASVVGIAKRCGDCENCTNCIDCDLCNECTSCTDCERCESCNECSKCTDCINCSSCVDCVGLMNAIGQKGVRPGKDAITSLVSFWLNPVQNNKRPGIRISNISGSGYNILGICLGIFNSQSSNTIVQGNQAVGSSRSRKTLISKVGNKIVGNIMSWAINITIASHTVNGVTRTSRLKVVTYHWGEWRSSDGILAQAEKLLNRSFKAEEEDKRATTIHNEKGGMTIIASSSEDSWRIPREGLNLTVDPSGHISAEKKFDGAAIDSSKVLHYQNLSDEQQTLDLGQQVSEQLENICQEKEKKCRGLEQELKMRKAKDEECKALHLDMANKLAEMKEITAKWKARQRVWGEKWGRRTETDDTKKVKIIKLS